MKHLRQVTFMAKLWIGMDHRGFGIATGFIDHRGQACYFGRPAPIYDSRGAVITEEVLDDVNSQIRMLQYGNANPSPR